MRAANQSSKQISLANTFTSYQFPPLQPSAVSRTTPSPCMPPLTFPNLTSSIGRSWSCVKEQERMPIRNGVGEQTMSIMESGRTGIYVCCQVNGYSVATTAWPHLDKVLCGEKMLVSIWDPQITKKSILNLEKAIQAESQIEENSLSNFVYASSFMGTRTMEYTNTLLRTVFLGTAKEYNVVFSYGPTLKWAWIQTSL